MDKTKVDTGVGIVATGRIAEIQEIGAAIFVDRRGKRAIDRPGGMRREPERQKKKDK